MTSSTALRAFLLVGILYSVHSEYFDSNNVKINLFYGPTSSDSVSYPLSEAEQVLDDPLFEHSDTVFHVQDYHEPQVEGYRQNILTDAYSELQICNFLVLDWGTGFVPVDDIKDPDIATLVPMVTAFLTKVHNRTNWDQFSVVAYARGTEFMQYVVDDLFQKSSIRIPRISQLAPQSFYQTEQNNDEIITKFVDTIHTDIGKHETNVSQAHAEFFPNGGEDPQPGCAADSERLDFCSRQRSLRYWAESLRNPLAFCSLEASSYIDYKTRQTDVRTEVPMGVACPSWARGKFYLDTNAESPYGMGGMEEQWSRS